MSQEDIVLNVVTREQQGKGFARRLRAAGSVPAVLYGHGIAASHYSVPMLELAPHLHHTGLLTLKIDGQEESCTGVIKDFQINVISGKVIHVDFMQVTATDIITANIEIEAHGVPAGQSQGGVLEQVLHSVEIRGAAGKMVDRLVVDVSKLELDGTLSLKDLPLPEGVVAVGSPEQIVFGVHLSRAEAAAESDEETGAEPEVIGAKKEE